jgi:hypothetical protein
VESAGTTVQYAYASGKPVSNTDALGLDDSICMYNRLMCGPPSGLIVTHQVPQDAVLYATPDGQTFFVPPNTNLGAVVAAGQANGLNPFAMQQAIGQFGTFDFQRSDPGYFISAYTDASNYAVGAYGQGAGLPLGDLIALGELFGLFMSSNPAAQSQIDWWTNGWQFMGSSNPVTKRPIQ